MSFDDAKAAASAMVRARDDGKPRDWIADLNRRAAAEVDAALRFTGDEMDAGTAPAASAAPGADKPSDPPLRGDDYQLEYYEDGCPKRPACLDRRSSRP